jgi:hypothetical protein
MDLLRNRVVRRLLDEVSQTLLNHEKITAQFSEMVQPDRELVSAAVKVQVTTDSTNINSIMWV